MIADIFTKATDVETFERLRDVLRNIGEPTMQVSVAYSLAQWLASKAKSVLSR